ncbi:MAG: hypothetical protein WCA46_12860 [Actinocatenispora sp.]
MRMLMKFDIDTEAGNQLIKAGQMEKAMRGMLDMLHPEAAYFTPQGGKRAGFMIFDLDDMADVPRILEPMFEELHAHVELLPVMNLEELQTGLSRM